MRARVLILPSVVALAAFGLIAPARADFAVLLTNLDQPSQASGASKFFGQSFIAGSVDQLLFGAKMQLDPSSLPAADGIKLEVEARNFDGTVGPTLFDQFTAEYNPSDAPGVITFMAAPDSNFVMSAGTGYWLVLSLTDSQAPGVSWDFTESNVYQSDLGFGLPAFNTSWTSDENNGLGNSTYYQPSDGPQLFSLLAVVPEPGSYLLVSIAGVTLALRGWVKKARLLRSFEHGY